MNSKAEWAAMLPETRDQITLEMQGASKDSAGLDNKSAAEALLNTTTLYCNYCYYYCSYCCHFCRYYCNFSGIRLIIPKSSTRGFAIVVCFLSYNVA